MDAKPVLLPFGDVSERGEITHAIEVDVAVQVIGLVLGDAREEVLGDDALKLALAVVILEPDRRVSRHQPPHVGNGQAALPALFHLIRQRRDDGVDDHGERDLGGLGITRVGLDLDDGDLLERVNLVGRQSGSVVLAHRLDHVVDEFLRRVGPDLFGRERLSLLPKNGMSEAGNLQDGHDARNCSTRIRVGLAPYLVSTRPTRWTPAARRRASVSKKRWNSSPCLKAMGVSSFSMAPLNSESPTTCRMASRSLASTGSGVPLGANTPAQM